jgi:hypothetical protein
MDDITFLQQCGIEIDTRWLVELIGQGESALEGSNYLGSLIRIADMLAQAPTSKPTF